MYKKNEGLTDNDILQNQFTTFLSTALCNHRKTYLRGIYRCRWRECVTDEIRSVCIGNVVDFVPLIQEEIIKNHFALQFITPITHE